MSHAASPFTGQRYGVVRGTREWEVRVPVSIINVLWQNGRTGFCAGEDRREQRCVAWENPRSAGGLAVLRRRPSQSVGAAALSVSAHVEGARAVADARSTVADAFAYALEGRESPCRHDHHRAAQRNLGQ